MKIFVSWSGGSAQNTAERLGEWLSRLFSQTVEVFVSSKDIEKGDRWAERLSQVLREYNFGIVVLNKENKDRPWINFEAGALSKGIQKSHLIPLLCGLTPGDLLESPLGQFQGVEASRAGLVELAKAINANLDRGLAGDALTEAFDVWWITKGEPICEAAKKSDGPGAKAEPQISMRDLMARIDRFESKVSDMIRSGKDDTPLVMDDPNPVAILTINDRICRWPIGDPSSNEFHFCGRKPMQNSPYCSTHAKRAYPSTEESKRR